MALDDSLLRARPKSTLPTPVRSAGGVSEAESAIATPERSDPLPRPGDAYMAHARRTPAQQMTLFFVGKDYLPDGFSYANLERVRMMGSDKPGASPVLVARFSGSVVTEVTIEGRHLQTLCNDIGQHLMPWVWEHPSPKDFVDDKATLIRKVTISVVES